MFPLCFRFVATDISRMPAVSLALYLLFRYNTFIICLGYPSIQALRMTPAGDRERFDLGSKYMWKPPRYTYPLHRPRQHDTHHTFDKSGLVVTAAGCGTRMMRSTSSVHPASVRVREWFQGPVYPPEWLVPVPPTLAVRLEPGEPDKGVRSAAAASGELEPMGSHDHSQDADVIAAVPAAARGAGAYLAAGGGAGASGTCASGIMARVGCRASLAAGNASLEVQKAGRGNAGSVCFGCEREGVGPRWRRRADGGGWGRTAGHGCVGGL
jgi:hypothetical protein